MTGGACLWGTGRGRTPEALRAGVWSWVSEAPGWSCGGLMGACLWSAGRGGGGVCCQLLLAAGGGQAPAAAGRPQRPAS